MIIKDGVNSEPFKLRIDGKNENPPIAQVWTEMNTAGRQPDEQGNIEVLHYATLDEIKALRDECNEALREMVGL